MRLLPPLAAGRHRWVLPMADRSAAVLTEAVLCAHEEGVEILTPHLSADPPLVLWTVCRARTALPQPRGVSEVAAWLHAHAVEVLQWDEADARAFSIPATSKIEPYADQVMASLQVAELAASLALPDGADAADAAHFLGLLHNARPWLTLGAADRSTRAADCLPPWLVHLDEQPAAARVAEALEILAGSRPGASRELAPPACRQRALEGRARWLETVPGPGIRLPALMARLARLDRLERHFHETLETEKLAAMAEFSAGAGHEINNPLAIIAGRAQLFLRDETDPERRRELALIHAQVKRAHEMIADMRLFARPPRPEPQAVDLVALVDAVLADLGAQAAEQRITLARTGEPGPLVIEADPAQLNVAIRAMCRNSMEAIGQQGQIEIALGRQEEVVQIRVSDNGPGIPPEIRRHVFDPFYSSRQAGRGLGLGLSKCWRLVTNHRGRIEVASQPGQGATFTITLPCRFAGQRAEDSGREARP